MNDQCEREEIHHRQLDLKLYRRSDGLLEVEGRLLDAKSHPWRRLLSETDIPAGAPVHDIRVRLLLDDDMVIHDAMATLSVTPFGVCQGAAEALEPLKGLRIGAGWNRRVRELLGGATTCRHIVELLGPMATTVIQGTAPQRLARMQAADGEGDRRARIDSCFAYANHREVVAKLWPELHRAVQADSDRT